MSETDNPLKMLITDFGSVFAAWLLGRPVRWARPLNVEFPAHPIQSDLLFAVEDEQGQLFLLHYEFQGRTSHKPMPYRQLEYMSQVAIREIPWPLASESPRLHSVVLYVGEGAGRGDTGVYTIAGLGNTPALQWQYQPMRLWEMTAENLLQWGQPAITALMGLTRLQQPEAELPQALRQIRTVADQMQRQRLLTAMVSLLPTEEVTQMVERLLEESETLLLDTPYLRRMRELGRQEGLREGLQEGRQEGRQEGLQEGRQEGREEALREAILEAAARRFNPPVSEYQELQRQLAQVEQPDALQQILLALFDVTDTAVIFTLIAEIQNESGQDS